MLWDWLTFLNWRSEIWHALAPHWSGSWPGFHCLSWTVESAAPSCPVSEISCSSISVDPDITEKALSARTDNMCRFHDSWIKQLLYKAMYTDPIVWHSHHFEVLQFLRHLTGQGLEVTPGVFLVTHPANDNHTVKKWYTPRSQTNDWTCTHLHF